MKARKTRLDINREHANQESAQTKPRSSLRDRLYLGLLILLCVLYLGITLKLAWKAKFPPNSPPCPPPMEGVYPDCH
jgi:hypothetical protein